MDDTELCYTGARKLVRMIRTRRVSAAKEQHRALADFDFVRANVDIPPKKGVMLVDSRPAARQYDPGHIPGALNIPDTQFEKMAHRLPADKTTLLIFYCGGLECVLSNKSADKARQLGYAELCLDTLPLMIRAASLYLSLGFERTDPYYGPTPPGTIFMALDL